MRFTIDAGFSEAMNTNELRALTVVCIALVLIVAILAACDTRREREHTRQVEVLQTNRLEHIHLFP